MSESVTMTASSTTLPGKGDASIDFNSTLYKIDEIIKDEERRFYLKAYPTIDLVNNRKVHCTVCRVHIGTAPNAETNIKMHPILRVTHCIKCHDFYNSGEFSKGEDGSELYCRWCGQGGEVYCCSSCPFVFCKSCIIKNLSRGVVADIEQNENWNCFNCAPKILWPLRAQHWALVSYIEAQKKFFKLKNLTDSELRTQMSKDNSQCCRLAKSRASNMSDSMESLESNASKRSASSLKKTQKSPSTTPGAKRQKTSNDEVVCTPDLMSMLEPDCQLTVAQKTQTPLASPAHSTPKAVTIQTSPVNNSTPPPLVLANTTIKLRQISQPTIRRAANVPPPPNVTVTASAAPAYHTINGYRIDLNTAARQETFRLPNGKLIQVKRHLPGTQLPQQQQRTLLRPVNSQLVIRPHSLHPNVNRTVPPLMQSPYNHTPNMPVQQQYIQPPAAQPVVRLNQPPNSMQNVVNPMQTNGSVIQHSVPQRPQMVRHVFPDNPIGQARTQLQNQIFNAMDICTHLTGKVQTLTNSNAYKQAKNYLEVKELYIHLSYLVTYGIGRFKTLQDKCLVDMRQLGFTNDADSLENGQLAAAVEYVSNGQLDDVDLFNTGSNSFHNQVYEYRKTLHENLNDADLEPLPPLMPLGRRGSDDLEEDDDENETDDWQKDELDDLDNDDLDESCYEDGNDDLDSNGAYDSTQDSNSMNGTEESMTRSERAHAYDRKLTRLVREYPSIWCTRHAQYSNLDVKRKHWRVIASHFKRGDSIKLRWKNIRKRFVRIERRMKQGKRFNGYFDKATNFLANRDLNESDWLEVDCGDDDGDVYQRKELDKIEDNLSKEASNATEENNMAGVVTETTNEEEVKPKATCKLYARPIEIQPIDERIIQFAKSHPVLWRKSTDPQYDLIDEQTRKSLWANFRRNVPDFPLDYIMDRWQQLFAMYKSFRLKTIKDKNIFANLELKYSKYLAKLYFLYKLDEEDLRNETNAIQDYDSSDENLTTASCKLQDMPDDKQFMRHMVHTLRAYPTLWNNRHVDYNDIAARERLWPEVANRLQCYKRDVHTIKKRWMLAKFAYERYCRESKKPNPDLNLLQKLGKNLPIDEMRHLMPYV